MRSIRSAVIRAPALLTALAVNGTAVDLNKVEGRKINLQLTYAKGGGAAPGDTVVIRHYVSQDGLTYVSLVGAGIPPDGTAVGAGVPQSSTTLDGNANTTIAFPLDCTGYRYYRCSVQGVYAGGDYSASSFGATAYYDREGNE